MISTTPDSGRWTQNGAGQTEDDPVSRCGGGSASSPEAVSRDLGLAFSTWSLTKLAEYLAAAGNTRISRESIRQILGEGGVSWLATKTWKASTDPDFIAKMHRVLDLYDHPPADGRVICADKFGPLNLQPRPGRTWRPAGHPARLRASYRRTGGVRHIIAALNLATGQITYRIRNWCSCRPTPPG